MAALTREQILKAPDIQKELVPVPEWGGEVWVRGLTGLERDKFEASVLSWRGKEQNVNMANVRSKLVVLALCDEEGNPLFTWADIQELGKKSAAALDRVFTVAQRLSGIGGQDLEDLTAERLEKSPFDGSVSA